MSAPGRVLHDEEPASLTNRLRRRRRLPLREVGSDPDPRFTFANERTFLAWNRTALALIGGGLAVAQFVHRTSTGARTVVALALIGLGAAIATTSYWRWERNERALRLRCSLPSSRLPALLAIGIGLIAVIVAVLVVILEAR